MRILHLIPFLWSGAGDVVSRLAASQAAHHDVAVVTSVASRGSRDWPRYQHRLRQAGVARHRLDLFDRSPSTFWPAQAELAALVGRFRPHVLHAHAGVPACAAVLAREVSGGPAVVAQFYNWGPNRPTWMDAMDLTGFRAADLVICSANHYAARLASDGVASTRLRLVRWGLDDRWFAPRPTRRGLPHPTIGFVGRIEPRKAQLELVEGFAKLRQRRPDLRLELVGPVADEVYARAIHEVITTERLETAVTLSGEVRDVRTRLLRWSAFVSLSHDEGQGMAVLEAMASHVPVVGCLAPGVEDALEEGRTGFVVSGRSPTRVAAAIQRCLDDQAGRATVVRGAREHVRRTSRWTHTLASIARAYREARAGEARR